MDLPMLLAVFPSSWLRRRSNRKQFPKLTLCNKEGWCGGELNGVGAKRKRPGG
jgi:hypothetical protein